METGSESGDLPMSGGNMSQVVLGGKVVKRTATSASGTIQRYLSHLRRSGLDWVPEPLGFDQSGRELLGFIEGEVVDGVPPDWFWQEDLLRDVAVRLRQLHDASVSFLAEGAAWNWQALEPQEVILHRDFAPYNCVFRKGQFVGLIDFDLCAPGPRIWDIAYTAYRFVPLMPQGSGCWSVSPFDLDAMLDRLRVFLQAYGSGDEAMVFSVDAVLATTLQRLDSMVAWVEEWVKEHPSSDLAENAATYAQHRAWLEEVVGQLTGDLGGQFL